MAGLLPLSRTVMKGHPMLKALGAIVLIVGLFILFPLIGTLIGAFTGWIVGVFWPTTFGAVLAHFGLSAFAPYQIGATLGFIGGFFKAIQVK